MEMRMMLRDHPEDAVLAGGARIKNASTISCVLDLLEATSRDLSRRRGWGESALTTGRGRSTTSAISALFLAGRQVVSLRASSRQRSLTKPIDFPVALARIETQVSRKRAMEQSQRLTVELERHNQFIRKTFGRYLSKDIVENLLSSPEGLALDGEKRTITILMSDLRGFALSEKLDPEQVVTMLNGYLGKMAVVVTQHNGTIDEFIGDAF